MNLLVTGGAGFIGSNFLRHIAERPDIQAQIQRLVNLDALTYAGNLANLKGLERLPNYVFERVNLRDQASVRRVIEQHDITHVIHLAAESHVDRSIAGPEAFIQSNVVGTFHLLEACRIRWAGHAAGRRFHQVSTDEVYGSLGPKGAFTESSPCAPNSPYAASKAAADMLLRAYHHTYGLPIVITNGSNNYGPYQYPEKLVPVVIQNLLARRPIPVYGDGLQVRDWLFVRDLAEALWLVFTRGRDGEKYNIGANEQLPNIQLVQMLCDLVDELAPALGGQSRRLISFVADRPGHDRRYAVDASKIQQELGWKPSTPAAQGFRQTVQWYLDNQDWVSGIQLARDGGQ